MKRPREGPFRLNNYLPPGAAIWTHLPPLIWSMETVSGPTWLLVKLWRVKVVKS